MLDAGADVTLIAPAMNEATAALPCRMIERAYRKGDLAGAWLVIIATDDARINDEVAAHAQEAGVLVNRADEPDRGDLMIPAHAHHGPVTLAVDTSGASPAAAGRIRRQLSAALDEDWPRLLELIAPFRRRAQRTIADESARRQMLRALTDDDMMRLLKDAGPDAVVAACERWIAGEQALPLGRED